MDRNPDWNVLRNMVPTPATRRGQRSSEEAAGRGARAGASAARERARARRGAGSRAADRGARDANEAADAVDIPVLAAPF